MSRFDPRKVAVLADLRRAAGLSQSQAAEFFGMQHRDSVSAWELGKRRPHATRRARFIVYLLDKLGLRRDGPRFIEVWNAVMTEEWGWKPLSDGELQACFPGTWEQLAAYQRELVWRAFAGDQAVVPALHQLPPPPRDFTGRAAELAALRTAIGEGVTIVGLWGMGGVGKTTLALKLAAELTPRYPDAQFYLDLKGTRLQPLSPAEAMAHVIRAYHPTARLPENEPELSNLYQSVLHDQRALLLMDNAADARQVAPLIPPAGCLLLITSRQHFTLPGLFALNLEALPPQDARDLLLTIAPRIGDQADALAKLCGGLPLALRLTASALAARMDLRPTDHVRRLRDATDRLQEIDAALSLSHEALGVEASLNLSYELLSAELRALWCMLSVFPETFDVPAAAAVWEVEPEPAHDALSTLVTRSLVEWHPGTGRYRLHDLARLFAETRLSESGRAAARRRHAAYYETVLRTAGRLYHQGGEALQRGLDLFDREWKNIQAGQAWAVEHAEEDEAAALLCSDYPRAGRSLMDLRLHPRERIRWREAALAAARRLKLRAAEGMHLHSLGSACLDLGEPRRAIEFCQQALTIAREVGDRRVEANVLGDLGRAHMDLGETRRAIHFYEQQLAIAREIGDRRGEGNALGNLGLAYKNLGELHRAIDFYEKASAIAREIGDRHGEGADLNNLGVAYYYLGQPHRAIEFFERALVIFRDILGDRHSEGDALDNLGLAYARLGEFDRAIEFYNQALDIAREVGDRYGEGCTLDNLGTAYAELGGLYRAIEFHNQALAIFRDIGDRRGEGDALRHLGVAHDLMGELHHAIDFYEQALVIFRQVGDRRREGNALWNLSQTLDKLGDREQAIAHAQLALKIFEEIETPNAAEVREQLAKWCE